MLTPEYLASCADQLLGLYDALNESIVADISRRIIKAGTITDTAKWKINQLQQNNALLEDIVKDVAEMTGISDTIIKEMFDEAGIVGLRNDVDPLIKAGYDVSIKLSSAMQQTIDAAVRKTCGDVNNLTLTTGTSATGAYIQSTDLAYMQVQSGTMSYTEAIKAAIKSAASDGAWCLYPSGYRSRMDTAVRRSVLTGINQTAAKVTEMNAESMGVEYYEVSAHAGARPSHSVWQGRVFKINGSTYKYPNFAQATGYGTGAGLCGWNCRHSFYPFWPGISQPAYSKEKLEWYDAKRFEFNGKKLNDYECSQIQRGYERDIREIKRTLTGYNAAIKATHSPALANAIKAEFDLESIRLKNKERELKSFCKQTNRRYDSSRVQVHALLTKNGTIEHFDRSAAQKAVWAYRRNRNGI